MNFKESYRLGQERKQLEITAREYDAYPKGLTISGSSDGVESILNDISNLTKEVRESAQQRAEGTEPPKNILRRIFFNLGYFVGSPTKITSMCTSNGLVNPFTGKALYQK